MNTLYLNIKDLAKNHKISLSQLERELGFGNGTISSWKKSAPSSDKLEKVADYFHVSTDYLLGRKDDKNKKDIDLKSDDLTIFSYGGKPIDKSDRDIIKAIVSRYKRDHHLK